MIRSVFLLTIALLAGSLQAEDEVPEGYVMQVMEPTGGNILRPEGWFYHERHREKSWSWTISKEDTHNGKDAYDTGVRIQAFVGVEENTGKTPEAFLKDFIDQKRKVAVNVHKDCDAADQGLFTRTCLEVTEGDYRILYSVFWGNEIDIAIVSIAGAKLADWDENVGYFNTMSEFELIDMERFSDDEEED
ncbi:MAG: hypothetical protein NWT08_03175 [Akkermansiaceae bacterium]|jgi:hypothetical protein|nr:hypothetical protein [Akkermansiaceae bacterium]MDP4646442.1 hypothetical protein [Akkermansiaceae bacterium]MDP4720639.1 hypothetical protein [Akkermansiaceae bacterium]MDP4780049.1 hypothetical protein [Akkermansiaceae bacterium]MDP4847643.1 hypothetical protein [Akkermansiaceae bacterium]